MARWDGHSGVDPGAWAGPPLFNPRAMPPTAFTFEPTSFVDLPGWSQDDHVAALRAFGKSCERAVVAVQGGTSPGTNHWHAALSRACEHARALMPRRITRVIARAFFETHFTPHRVVHKARQGLLTGYYEPVLCGTRTPDDRFRIPIYRRPTDLVNLVDESMRGAQGDALTHARKTKNGLQPYPTRAEIESEALKDRGLELLYLADPVDAYFMQIQGSGRIKLPDGTAIRLSYDGKNGRPYSSIGRYLIDTGRLGADELTLHGLARWLKADPERAKEAMWHNPSYVFFRELAEEEANGPLGVLNIPLTPGRSLAVDASVHAIGTPIYVAAPTLLHALPAGPFQRLMIAQDVGSAIKGPERGDIFFGSGRAAGRRAGVTKHAGNFFVLLPRGQAPALAAAAEAELRVSKAARPTAIRKPFKGAAQT
jgi:membrane-bound lytic murein transglycosylase A